MLHELFENAFKSMTFHTGDFILCLGSQGTHSAERRALAGLAGLAGLILVSVT